MINSSRSKIHPKIIFKVITNGRNVLVIGVNNFDIIEVLKHKKSKIAQINSGKSGEIIEKLQRFDSNQFDFIILNLEISKLRNIKDLVSLISKKSKIAIFRVRDNNLITKDLVNKKQKLLDCFKQYNINIIKKFYCRKNKIYNNIFAHFFSYYVIYITNKNGDKLAFQEAFTEKFLKRFLAFFKTQETVLTSEKN